MKKIAAISAIVVFVALLLGANYLIIKTHYISRENIEKAMSSALKRECTLESASFDNKNGLTLTGLDIKSLLNAKTVRIISERNSITNFTPDRIIMESPALTFAQAGGNGNGLTESLPEFLSVIKDLKKLPSLEITNGTIAKAAPSRGRLLVIQKLNIEFTPLGQTRYLAEGSGELPDGLACGIKAEINLAEIKVNAVLNFNKLLLEKLKPGQIPEQFAGIWPACRPKGAADVTVRLSFPSQTCELTRYEIKFDEIHATVYTDIKMTSGVITAGDSGENAVCGGRIEIGAIELANKKFTDTKGFYQFTNNHTMAISGICGKFYNGAISGQMNLYTDKSTYDMLIEFADVSIKEYVQDSGLDDKNVTGTAGAKMEFTGNLTERRSFACSGTLNMKSGHFWKMPVFMELLGIFKIGDPASFDSGAAKFRVENEIIYIDSMALLNSNLGITGNGRVSFEGNLDLLINIKFAQNFLPQTSIGVIFEVWSAMEKSLYAFEVTGTFKKPVLSVKPFPLIDDNK